MLLCVEMEWGQDGGAEEEVSQWKVELETKVYKTLFLTNPPVP